MARYISEYSLSKDADTVYNDITQILTDSGYDYVNYEYEDVFKKGNNILSAPCFIKVSLNDKVLKLEAWVASGIGIGVFYKELKPNRKLKKFIEEIESFIAQKEGECVSSEQVKRPNCEKIYPKTQKPFNKKTFVKKYAAKSLVKEFTSSAIVFYVLSAISILLGAASKSISFCAVFIIIALLSVITHITKNTVIAAITALLGCFGAILYVRIISLGFLEFIIYEMELRTNVVFTVMLAAYFAAMWIITAVSMLITAYKTNKYYKILSE